MGAFFAILAKIARYAPVVLKYAVNIGPLAYEAIKWGKKVIQELKAKKSKTPEQK
jgi:hypothetical protein